MYEEIKRPAKEAPTLSIYLKRMKNGLIRCDAEVQRLAGQWDRESESRLVETVLTNDFISPIVLATINQDVFILDGLQRSTTLLKFRNNEMKVTRDIIVPYRRIVTDDDGTRRSEWVEYNLKNRKYSDLPEELKDSFDSYQIETVVYENCSRERANMLIARLNIARPMSNSQKAFTHQGNVATDIRDIINTTFFFSDCGAYTLGSIKNGTVERIVTESYVSIFGKENWNKDPIKMAEYMNDNATKENLDALKELFMDLYPVCVNKYGEFFNPKNTYVFITAYYECKKMGYDANDFADFLDYISSDDQIDGKRWSDVDINRSTKNKGIVLAKLDFITKMVKKYFSTEDSATVIPTLDFVNANVSGDFDETDIAFYEEALQEIMEDSIVLDSLLREEGNHNSMVAIIAYTDVNGMSNNDVVKWMTKFGKENAYLTNQQENFERMKEDVDKYMLAKKGVA